MRSGPAMPGDRSDVRDIARHLREHAHVYYPELGMDGLVIELREGYRRPASWMYTFELSSEQPRVAHRVVVKFPLRRADDPPVASDAHDPVRPRLAPISDANAKLASEYRAMSSVEAHLRAKSDPRLEAVRVLDRVPANGREGIALEAIAARTLSELTRRQVLGGTRALKALSPFFRTAGVWLREFHSMDPPLDVPVRFARGVEVREQILRYVDHLGAAGVCASVLGRIAAVANQDGEMLYPRRYPVAWSHGDFALRNMFVRSAHRVAVFDVLGRRRTPIFEDLMYFVTAMTTGRAQVFAPGLMARSTLFAALEQAFFVGYFAEQEIPIRRLRAYQLLVLLDRWTWFRVRPDQGAPSALPRRVHQVASDRFFGRAVDEVIAELEGTEREVAAPC
jgi:aminoglycoside phosphotransferase (APT) family kinase protein